MKLTFPKLSRKKIVGIIAAALAVILLLVWGLGSCGGSSTQASAEYEPYTVNRGDITVSVTGSGTVEPIEQYEIQSIVTGDILEDYVTLGAEVKKDDILYVIDSASAENSIERSETSYEQQLISYNEKVNDYNKAQANRNIYAPSTGVITELYVENGDSVNAGTKLAVIENSASLTVRVPFLAANAKNIYKNQSATVYFDDRNESHTGYVSHVTTGTYVTSAGAIVSDIEITFKNPGAILAGETVTATVGNYACNDYGSVQATSTETITAEVSGDIENLNYSKGDEITGGNLLLNIADDSSYSDLRSSELSLKNSRLSLDDQIEKLDDYTIRSPISGTVISKTMKGGDTLDGNKSSLAIVADMSKLTFDISVDELYIQNIEVGQTVTVTADALPDRTFEGVVDTVSIIGTATSGVTVYPVTVVISEYDGLLPGMNVDAEIVISNASDVLTVPVNAVSRGNLVLVKDGAEIGSATQPQGSIPDDRNADERPAGGKDMTTTDGMKLPEGMTPPDGNMPTPDKPTSRPDSEASAQTEEVTDGKEASGEKSEQSRSKMRIPDAPEGYKYVIVETGVANDDYVEIVSGLSEGDVIYVTVVKNTSTQESAFGMGMGGGIGGGMPAGGMGAMPNGGMPSGNRSGAMPNGGMR